MKNPQKDPQKEEMAAQFALLRPLIHSQQRMQAALHFGLSLETINRYLRGKVCKLTTAQNLYNYFTTLNQL